MIELYNNDYYNNIDKQFKKLRLIYIIIGIVVLLFEAGILIYYSTRPYGYEFETLFKIILIVVGVLFTFFSFYYFAIPFGRVIKYRKMLQLFTVSEIYKSSVTILKIDKTPFDNKGIDFYKIEVLEWNKYENDFVNRKVNVDNEIQNIDFTENEIVTFYTCSNILIAYERN